MPHTEAFLTQIYFTPCISFLTIGVNPIKMNPAKIATIVKIKKKVAIEY